MADSLCHKSAACCCVAATVAQATLTPAAELVQSLGKVQEFAKTCRGQEPIRGTPFEKLMVAVLQNTNVADVYALHSEPGAGKSTASTLAALELKGRQPKDVIVPLQNDFERQLKSFFCLANIEYTEYTAEIARPFFTSLKDKGIRVRFWIAVQLLSNLEID